MKLTMSNYLQIRSLPRSITRVRFLSKHLDRQLFVDFCSTFDLAKALSIAFSTILALPAPFALEASVAMD